MILIPVYIIVLSLSLDLLLGDPPTFLHPVGWQGRFITTFWALRSSRSPGTLFVHGLFIITAGLTLTLSLVGLVQWMGLKLLVQNGRLFVRFLIVLAGAVVLKGSFSFRNLIKAGNSVRCALEDDDVDEARRLVSYHLVSRNVDNLDEAGLSSAAIESLSENFTDSLSAPLFWNSLFGPVGAWCYRFANTADAMLGYRSGEREWGGKAAARLDDILSWFPARLSGWVLCAAALPSGLSFSRAVQVMLRDSRKCESPNSGWTMAAAAGALGVALEKKDSYLINAGGDNPSVSQLKDLNRLLYWSLVIFLIPSLAAAALIFKISLKYLNLPGL